ncbi:alpha/beta hydrolase [Herbiconiux sp. L3-i23]|uniref:alpha/beta hydrolase n=1 Tax=Herbiconiux sp. L3-i23 TaxID=2905871 RepID=UPI0020617F92|nr:dienelactone hydrolase family protein [Herbiconiux sp. L3-i23]BDI24045.1 phospholipase [Herbiconiux sp. L3-i23]
MRPIRDIDADAVVWSGSRSVDSPLLVFLHGFGGNEHDWTPYLPMVPDGVSAAAIRAPRALGDRWAWAHFGEEGIGAFSASGRGVHAWLDGVARQRVALVGWSQGAAMAIHLARPRPDRFAAVSMAGGFVWELRDHSGLASRRIPVRYGIGTDDEVIPRRMIVSAQRWLERHTAVELHEYPGVRHTLTPEIAADAIDFAVRHVT